MRSFVKELLLAFALVLTLFGQNWGEMEKVVASDRHDDDQFGCSADIDGDYAVIGAIYEDYDLNGQNYLGNAGAAYFFKRNGTEWSQVQKIVAPIRVGSEYFGREVHICGNYAIVGSYSHDYDASHANYMGEAGAAWIYYNDNGTWTFQQKLVAPDRAGMDYFGHDVCITENVAIVGAPLEDEDASGDSTLSMAGSAYIFTRSGTTWSFAQKLVSADRAEDDQFGACVAIDGNYVAIGAYKEDEDENGENTYNLGGSAYIFHFNGSSWVQQQKIVPDVRVAIIYFGYTCAMDSNRVVFGTQSNSTNKAWIFSRSGSSWSQEGLITPSDGAANDSYGCDISLSGDRVIVGAWAEDEDALGNNYMEKSGSAYIYEYNSGWAQTQKIVASDRAAGDYFGHSVGISGNYIVVGARYEDIEDSPGNRDAGAAYFFGDSSEVPLPITLSSFTAKAKAGVVELAWETASETENSHFLVYRDGEVIGQMEGNGTTTQQHSYSFLDTRVQAGVYSYAIADVSYGGALTLHPGVKVEVKEELVTSDFVLHKAYPNPFNPCVALSMEYSVGSNTVINIYNTQGTLVDQLINGFIEAGYHEFIWDASDMASGVYVVKTIIGDNVANIQKVALMK